MFPNTNHDIGGAARVVAGVFREGQAHAQSDVAVTCDLYFIAIGWADQATIMVPRDLKIYK